MSQDPVPVVSPPGLPTPVTLVCSNCGAPLTGPYCAACGQRHEPHVHTMAHFASEAFESITHADSRLWRTLGYLLTRPGRLTREFFEGRRARYLPPFRLYLVISVVFFLVGLPEDVNLKLTGDPVSEEAARQLRADVAAQSATMPKAAQEIAAQAAEQATRSQVNVSLSGLDDFCKAFTKPGDPGNEYAARLRDRCLKLAAGDGRTVWNNGIHQIPRAMFIFLPVLALVMKLLYWRPKRYYVEHLLFLVHNHAFVFLTLTIMILLDGIPWVGEWFGWVWTAFLLYMMWYIFRAMRNVYGQGRALTLAKYTVLGFTYIAAGFVMLLLTLLYSAFFL
jgi:hypothetical protein